MPTYRPKYSYSNIEGKKTRTLSTETFGQFSPGLLGLGDLTQKASTTDAIAAVFDLQGFTNFCKQIDPQLSVPTFLSPFLAWLLEQIKTEMTRKTDADGAALWGPLPFFVKFMGDGLLVLWDSADTTPVSRRNILLAMSNICRKYPKKFLPDMQNKVVEPPSILRCGAARGAVFSVGNGNDFVGSCINMAARLQKLGGITFVFNRRGFEIDGDDAPTFFKDKLLIAKVSIRGIGDRELVCIRKEEYEKLKSVDKKQFVIG
jgi:class 3 adenylate cyclase